MFELDDRRQTVIARFEIDYRREVAYPADLRVGVRVLAIGNSSFQIGVGIFRSEEHTSELQSLMRISYAVFCLKKKTKNNAHKHNTNLNDGMRIKILHNLHCT